MLNINILYTIIKFITFILIGFFLVRWIEKKKGWIYSVKTDIYLIISWKSIIIALLICLDLISEALFFPLLLSTSWIILIFFFSFLLISFFFNLYIGFLLFKKFHKENKRDYILIILLIVIVEYIIDNLILYPISILMNN